MSEAIEELEHGGELKKLKKKWWVGQCGVLNGGTGRDVTTSLLAVTMATALSSAARVKN